LRGKNSFWRPNEPRVIEKMLNCTAVFKLLVEYGGLRERACQRHPSNKFCGLQRTNEDAGPGPLRHAAFRGWRLWASPA
jgi:hypothetical protein